LFEGCLYALVRSHAQNERDKLNKKENNTPPGVMLDKRVVMRQQGRKNFMKMQSMPLRFHIAYGGVGGGAKIPIKGSHGVYQTIYTYRYLNVV
jgi:hypothetical protein